MPAGKKRIIWLELKGADHGESLLVNVDQIAALEEGPDGVTAYCGGFQFLIPWEQQMAVWALIESNPDYDQILPLKGLQLSVLIERGLIPDR